MPRQEFVLSYLVTPDNYETDLMGVAYPLLYPLQDVTGYKISYNPVSIMNGFYQEDSILVDRNIFKAGTTLSNWVGDKVLGLDAESAKMLEGESGSSNQALNIEVETAERTQEQAGHIEQVSLGESTLVREGEVPLSSISALKRAKDAPAHLDFFVYADISPSFRDSKVAYELLLGERSIELGSVSLEAYQAERSLERMAEALTQVFGERSIEQEAGIEWMLDADKSRGRISTIVDTMYQSIRHSRPAMFLQKAIDGIRRMQSNEADIIDDVIFTERYGRHALTRAKVIYTEIDGKASRREQRWTYGNKISYAGGIDNKVIMAVFHTPESAIRYAMVQAKKVGYDSRIFKAILAESKIARDSELMDALMAEGKAGVDSLIENRFTKFGAIKGGIEGIKSLLPKLADRGGIEADWVERTMLALMHYETRESFIEHLQTFDKVDKDSIIEALTLAEVPDPEGIIFRIEESGYNESKDNRPAGMMPHGETAWWDVGFEELMETWKPGWDYMGPPSTDYDYEKDAVQVYDLHGVPYKPLSPVNLPDVDVDIPITHPIPDWSDIGREEAWVHLYTFQEIVVNLATIWKKETARISGMTAQEALQYVLGETYSILEKETLLNKEYERAFRFVRWYAETIASKDSVPVLHRVYRSWTDGLLANNGIFTYPHNKSQFSPNASGAFQASSTSGYLEFTVDNYIDAELTLSMVVTSPNESSSSNLRVYVDGTIQHTHTSASGAKRLSFPVVMGRHTYRMEYTAELGDTIKMSGLDISGVQFESAHTTLRDKGSIRGMRAVHDFIQSLLTYYQRHHKDKSKGARGVKQRKIWLS